MPKPFLTAAWRYLAMANYEVAAAALARLIPHGTELDTWQGRTYVSVVGFLFLDTRVLGIPIPWHRNFEELNLRFYVRRRGPEGWRRGVVFIKEIVPRWAIAAVARGVYNENYVAHPMRHAVEPGARVAYEWQEGGRWQRLAIETERAAQPLVPGSEAEFITEHYWGYAAQRDGACVEYRVEHPAWRVWAARRVELDCDAARLYGPEFAAALALPPASAFVAEGSPVVVHRGIRLR